MKKKILNFNINDELPHDYDPLLGKSVSEYLRSLKIVETSIPKTPHEGSIFDEIDNSFVEEKIKILEDKEEKIEETIEILEQERLIEPQAFETFDGEANSNFNETLLDNKADCEIIEEIEAQKIEISNEIENLEQDIQSNEAIENIQSETPNSYNIEEENITTEIEENPSINLSENQNSQNEEWQLAQKQPRRKKSKKKQRNKIKLSKIQIGAFFVGTFSLGLSLLSLIASIAAPLGPTFEEFSSLSWYWAFFAIVAIIAWIIARAIPATILSLIVLIIYLIGIIPPIGQNPTGGNKNRITIGWANINNSSKAFENLIEQASKNEASLIMLAGANGLNQAPKGWLLIEAPTPNDPTALAVIAKENWRAVTLAGEPTMARPNNDFMTVIGINPPNKKINENNNIEREALINRAANRAGNEEIPVLAIGDFSAAAWNRNVKFFARTGQLKRIVCGGYLGTTVNRGLFAVAFDHAFARGLNIQKCKIGARLSNGGNSPLWISVEGK